LSPNSAKKMRANVVSRVRTMSLLGLACERIVVAAAIDVSFFLVRQRSRFKYFFGEAMRPLDIFDKMRRVDWILSYLESP
jgi:hypothetical protein